MPGFSLYEDTDLRRATAHKLYYFAIEVGFGANGYLPSLLIQFLCTVCTALVHVYIPLAPNPTSIAKQ